MENGLTARDLRIKLVREVAAPLAQAKDLSQQFEVLRSEWNILEKAKEVFSNGIVGELKSCAQKGELKTKGDEIQGRYLECLAEYEQKQVGLEAARNKLADEIKVLERKAWEALTNITNDVVAGRYGRGVLKAHFNTGKIMRVIGAIEELKEGLSTDGIHLLSKVQVSGDDARKVAEMCADGRYPLFHIDTAVMPLNEEEIKAFCLEVDDYRFLKKNIPGERIPWELGYVYRIDRRTAHTEKNSAYMVNLGNEKAVFVKLEKGIFPHQTLTILGKIEGVAREEIDKVIEYVLDWLGKEGLPIDLKAVPGLIKDASGEKIVYNILNRRVFEKFPGIVVEVPQWETQ